MILELRSEIPEFLRAVRAILGGQGVIGNEGSGHLSVGGLGFRI